MARKRKHQNDQVLMQNAVKTLLANIRFASVDDPISSIVVTSSVPNEGKSTITMNLARAIATSGRDVLLVETDMRRRSLAAMLGVHPKQGLYSVLAGDVALEDAVVPTKVGDFYFLDSEPNIPNPADILASHRFRRFVKEVSAKYDYVIFDTPPVGTFVDAAVIAAVVDATVVVVRENFVKRRELVGAFEQLQKAEANVIGVVLNGCEQQSNDYYYAYYNGDGVRVDPEAEARAASRVPAAKAQTHLPRSNAPRPAAKPQATPAPKAQAPVAAATAPAATAQRAQRTPQVQAPRPIAPDTTAAMISQFQNSGH